MCLDSGGGGRHIGHGYVNRNHLVASASLFVARLAQEGKACLLIGPDDQVAARVRSYLRRTGISPSPQQVRHAPALLLQAERLDHILEARWAHACRRGFQGLGVVLWASGLVGRPSHRLVEERLERLTRRLPQGGRQQR